MRVLQTVVVLLGVVFLTVVLARVSGNPVRELMGAGPYSTEERVAEQEEKFGLNKPLYQQYFLYLSQVVRGEFGNSLVSGRSVRGLFWEHFKETLKLTMVAVPIVVIGGITLGTLAASRRGQTVDLIVRILTGIAQAAPAFWVAILLIFSFGVWLKWAPFGGDQGWSYVWLPAVAVSLFPMAGVVRITRTAVLNTLGQQYVTVARAKGLPESTVYLRYALRNAMIPIVTYIGIIVVASILLGAVAVEIVFGWPGIGSRALKAVHDRDLWVLQGFFLAFGGIYALGNLLVDIAYAYIDPRVRVRD
jgi:peptide/nickel transport system permease protein